MKCPNCDSNDVMWDTYFVVTIPPIGSYIPRPKFVLGCNSCSETLQTIDLDDVAEFLNSIKWKVG
jgi:hypothetical protein